MTRLERLYGGIAAIALIGWLVVVLLVIFRPVQRIPAGVDLVVHSECELWGGVREWTYQIYVNTWKAGEKTVYIEAFCVDGSIHSVRYVRRDDETASTSSKDP